MKRISGILGAALIAASAVTPAYAIRRNALRIGCGAFGAAVAALTYGGLKAQKKAGKPAGVNDGVALVMSAAFGCAAGGVPYLALDQHTPEWQYEMASTIIGEICERNPIVGQSFENKHELLALLKGLYFGELWLIKARNDMQPLQERITDALSKIGSAKEGAYGDVEFINKCDDLGRRARVALQNVSLALKAIEDAIASNSWETVR